MALNGHTVLVVVLAVALAVSGCTAVDQPSADDGTATPTGGGLADPENATAEEVTDRFLTEVRAVDVLSATEVRTTDRNGSEPETVRATLVMRPGEGAVYRKYRSGDQAGTAIISNGSVRWRYDEESNSARRMTTDVTGAVDRLETILEEGEVAYEGVEQVDGRDTYHLRVNHTETGHQREIHLWIDSQRWVPVKMRNERAWEDGFTVTIRLEDVSIGVDVPEGKFTPPAEASVESSSLADRDVEEFDSRDALGAAVNLTVPDPSLPVGYELESARRLRYDEGTSVILRYGPAERDESGNATRFTVSKSTDTSNELDPDGNEHEATTVAGQDAVLYETDGDHAFTSVAWHCDGYAYAVLGAGSNATNRTDRTLSIAESVACG